MFYIYILVSRPCFNLEYKEKLAKIEKGLKSL